jgi:hypothetical protein
LVADVKVKGQQRLTQALSIVVNGAPEQLGWRQ